MLEGRVIFAFFKWVRGKNLSHEKPRAHLPGDQIGILANPAEPGPLGPPLVEHRTRVHVKQGAVTRDEGREKRIELAQLPFHGKVVVASPAIARNYTGFLIVRVSFRRIIIDEDGND